MTKLIFLFLVFSIKLVHAQIPDTVTIRSGELRLKGLLWRPTGDGPFPTLIFCHGSLGGSDTIHDAVREASVLGPLFVKNGYIFLGLFRRGVGLSQGQGENSTLLMEKAFKQKGQQGRNAVQLQQMETTQLQDMISGITFLRNRADVDSNRIAVICHSFGGSLALLFAEHDQNIKAAVIFSPGGYSWNLSPQLRDRLLDAVKNINVATMIIHAQNDYSVNPGYALDSMRKKLGKPSILKIYPKFRSTPSDGHNLIFSGVDIWKEDVLKFLSDNLKK